MAWVRTAVSLLALGLVLAKFSLFLARLDPALSLAATNRLSLALVIAGGAVALVAAVATVARGGGGRPWRHGRSILMLGLAAVVAGAAAYAAVYVIPR